MEPFAQAVEAWHDFYLMIGTAAATLIGLLFVSLSLNVEVITRKESADLRLLAAHSFGNFMSVLMFAVLFLIPSQVPLGLGLPLLGIGCYGLINTIRRWREARRHPPLVWGLGGGVTRRFHMPASCFLALIIVAVFVLLSRTGSLYWLVPVMILLLLGASVNAWDLLMALRTPPKES
jgi:modulator of FtsH protease